MELWARIFRIFGRNMTIEKSGYPLIPITMGCPIIIILTEKHLLFGELCDADQVIRSDIGF
jgi:hypothetical protein